MQFHFIDHQFSQKISFWAPQNTAMSRRGQTRFDDWDQLNTARSALIVISAVV